MSLSADDFFFSVRVSSFYSYFCIIHASVLLLSMCSLLSYFCFVLQLFEEFAEPFSLWECKLAIIHCSGHYDIPLVETIWLNIIETELRICTVIGPNDKMTVLMSKIKSLGQEYAVSPRCFPVRKYLHFRLLIK